MVHLGSFLFLAFTLVLAFSAPLLAQGPSAAPPSSLPALQAPEKITPAAVDPNALDDKNRLNVGDQRLFPSSASSAAPNVQMA